MQHLHLSGAADMNDPGDEEEEEEEQEEEVPPTNPTKEVVKQDN